MASHNNFKDTILKLLSETNYSMDNLSQDDISSFENLKHLQPLFTFLSQSVSEANCITPEELEEFKKLQASGKVKYGDDLEEAIQAHSSKDQNSSVPFKESLNDAEQELTLLKEELHCKQVLHQELCSTNAQMTDDICELKKKQQRAEAEQKEVIKNICSTTKVLKENLSEAKATVDEIHDDIIGLAHNAGSPDASSNEGIHSLTSELNKSLSSSVCSLASSSSWQTIKGKDSNIKYMCQLSYDKYQRMHKQFLKRLTKLLEALSKVGQFQNNSLNCMDLQDIKQSFEKQMFTLIGLEAELEGLRAARVKVKELHRTTQTGQCLVSRLNWELEQVKSRIDEESFNQIEEVDLATVCQQWAECKALEAMEQKKKERIEYLKCLIEKMDELMKPLTLKMNADKILLELLQYEKEKIQMSINMYKSFYQTLQDQFDQMKKRIETMQMNLEDFRQFCTLPIDERNELVEQLASIVCSDNEGVQTALQHLTESSRREHATTYEHYVQVKNQLVTSGKNMEESYNMAMSQCSSSEAPSELIKSIQRSVNHMDSVIQEVNSDIPDVIQCITEKK